MVCVSFLQAHLSPISPLRLKNGRKHSDADIAAQVCKYEKYLTEDRAEEKRMTLEHAVTLDDSHLPMEYLTSLHLTHRADAFETFVLTVSCPPPHSHTYTASPSLTDSDADVLMTAH